MTNEFKVENRIKIDRFYSFFKRLCEKNYRFEGEIHDFWECVYVKQGNITVSGDERVYNLGRGDIVFHKPLELHKFAVNSDEGAELIIFSFSMRGEAVPNFENKVFSLTSFQKNIMEEMLEYIKHNEVPCEKNSPFSYLYPAKTCNNYLENLSIYVIRLFLSLTDNGSIAESLVTQESIIYKKAMEYMENNADKNITVPEIAKICAVSESGIKRIFSKYAAKSVHRSFLNIKIKKALLLLREGRTVSETAEELNFGSQSYFSVAFKRETGKNPSDFKKYARLR